MNVLPRVIFEAAPEATEPEEEPVPEEEPDPEEETDPEEEPEPDTFVTPAPCAVAQYSAQPCWTVPSLLPSGLGVVQTSLQRVVQG